jgi:Reverse transcriptase (RNA-dependent DNA polymerase)
MKLRKEHKVLRLKKALYELKQALRAWNTRIDNYFKKNGFKQRPFEVGNYVKTHKDEFLIVALYVDDLFSWATTKGLLMSSSEK